MSKKPHRKGKRPSAPPKNAVPAQSESAQKSTQRSEKHATHRHAQKPSNNEAGSVKRKHEAPARSTTEPSDRRGKVNARNPRAQQSIKSKNSATARHEVSEGESRKREGAAGRSPSASQSEAMQKLRLAKRLADAGLCSRRDAERFIEQGRVSVNGTTITSPATTVSPKDYVKLDGVLVANKPTETRLFLYHKPRGLITTARDTHGRPTVFDALSKLAPKGLPRLLSVGRLDLDSEGLLLLTTSGTLARTLELPATGLPRTYRVRILGALEPSSIAKLARGITVDGVQYGPIMVEPEQASARDSTSRTALSASHLTRQEARRGDNAQKGRNRWVIVTLTEGKNREIRRVFESLGHSVSRLIRVSYGPFTLGKLPRGTLMEVKPNEWKKALKEAGVRL